MLFSNSLLYLTSENLITLAANVPLFKQSIVKTKEKEFDSVAYEVVG